MLGKLIKYEFKACSRYFVPVYIAMVLIFLINSFLVYSNLNNREVNDVVVGIMVFITFGVFIVFSVISIYVIAKRFGQGIFGDEGYLTNTLPVSTSNIIISKAIVILIFSILSTIVMIVSLGMVFLAVYASIPANAIAEFNKQFMQVIYGIRSDIYITMFKFILATLISTVASTIMVYFCVSVAHLKSFVQHKYLVGILTYILLSIVQSTVSQNRFIEIFAVNDGGYVNPSVENSIDSMINAFNSLSQEAFIQSIIIIALGFAATYYIVSRKLNLE